MDNKEHKYKSIIAPLLFGKKIEKGMPHIVTLNNKIDYVHWDNPNELVDRLRLLETSRQAGHNAHNNEILLIIEELCEASLVNYRGTLRSRSYCKLNRAIEHLVN